MILKNFSNLKTILKIIESLSKKYVNNFYFKISIIIIKKFYYNYCINLLVKHFINYVI